MDPAQLRKASPASAGPSSSPSRRRRRRGTTSPSARPSRPSRARRRTAGAGASATATRTRSTRRPASGPAPASARPAGRGRSPRRPSPTAPARVQRRQPSSRPKSTARRPSSSERSGISRPAPSRLRFPLQPDRSSPGPTNRPWVRVLMRYLSPPTLTSILNQWRHLPCRERSRMLQLADPMTDPVTRRRISSMLGFDARALIPDIERERRWMQQPKPEPRLYRVADVEFMAAVAREAAARPLRRR